MASHRGNYLLIFSLHSFSLEFFYFVDFCVEVGWGWVEKLEKGKRRFVTSLPT
jgi:hypothetical protein